MPDLRITPLDHRALFVLSGEDRRSFLQGLVSADVDQATEQRGLYGAFLTPQGKFLYDFFIAARGDDLLLEVERAGREDFMRRLSRFKLRSKVTLAAYDDWQVFALTGDDGRGEPGAAREFAGGLAMIDPRLPAAGQRAWLPPAEAASLGLAEMSRDDWDRHRISLGLPDGSRDLVPEKTILLEARFDEFNGVDWQKGCFMGQEVTARSKYRGQIKKKLMPVDIDGPPPEPGTVLLLDGQEAGEMRSNAGAIGLAIVRLDCLAQDRSLTAGESKIMPRKP
jgi:folate-binding protein YgfZ